MTEHEIPEPEGWSGFLAAWDPRMVKLNVLLIAMPIAIWASMNAHNASVAFLASMVAIMPLAFLMGKATEEIALRTGETIGGLLNATFGNAAELIIAGIAVFAAASALGLGTPEGDATADTMIQVVQASLIGSILGNLLLVLGLAFVWGGLRFQQQEFAPVQVGSNGSLLMIAVMALVIPTAFHLTTGESGDLGVVNLSHITAIILLALYGLFLLFQLRTHVDLFATDGAHHEEESHMSNREAIVLLIVSTILVAWMAEILVHSIEEGAESLGFGPLFIGVILLPLFGNAAEHFTAVTVAGKDKMDLSFAIAVGSSTQIAVFVAPLMVLLAWGLGVPLTFEFGLLETVAVFLAVIITNGIASDGKSNWLEGMMLLGTYAVLGAAFYFHP